MMAQSAMKKQGLCTGILSSLPAKRKNYPFPTLSAILKRSELMVFNIVVYI